MHKHYHTWNFVRNSMEQGIAVMLLYVMEYKGSSPGRNGFFMVVDANGNMHGSVGGGIMEHKFVEMARDRLKDDEELSLLRRQVHDKQSGQDQSGMICSGEQTIFLHKIGPHELEHIQRMLNSISQYQNGTLQLTPQGISFFDESPATDFYFNKDQEGGFVYKERTGYKNKLYIIGGGHCALAFSKLMAEMDFLVHVFDEREGLNTMLQNNYAYKKEVIGSYDQLDAFVPSGEDVYVVIMTFGYRTDEKALRALLGKKFKYLGMMGSSNKIETMFTQLKQEGVSENVLNTIYSPIGISIRSQTPEEIAVSIAAQIIQVKNAK